jgi:phosphatidylinositol alpha-1,6-mannosyltransferase
VRVRVLIAASGYDPSCGGIQTYTYDLARSLSVEDRIVLLVPRKAKGVEWPDHGPQRIISIEPMLVSRWPLDIIASFLYQAAIIKRFEIQATLVTHWTVNGPAARWCRQLFSTPYVVTAHGMEILPRSAANTGCFQPHLFQSMQGVLDDASRVLAVSRYTRQRLEKNGMRPDHIRVIPNAVRVEDFAIVDKKRTRTLRERWGIEARKVILTVGRLVARKGLDTAIRAMSHILAEVPDAVYLIVGVGPEDEVLRTLARQLDLADKVIFAGAVPQTDLPYYYDLCDVFTMPCREIVTPQRVDAEGFGIVFLEANACGKPVVAGRSGGASDAVVDSETGFLVDPLDVVDVAQATVRLLTDQSLAVRLGENGRRRVENELNWTRVGQAVRNVISEVIAGR